MEVFALGATGGEHGKLPHLGCPFRARSLRPEPDTGCGEEE